jgi:V/A-type H+-transporting ATPase subunit C
VNYRLKFDTQYGFAVGLIRVLEKRFLTKQLLDRLVQVSSPDEAGRILSESGYGKDIAGMHSWKEIEVSIDREWVSVLGLICQLSRDSVWTDLFRKRIDFHNLRVILRETKTGEALDALLREGGLVAVEIMRNAVQSEKPEPLPFHLQRIVDHFQAYSNEEMDFLTIDSTIDQAEVREWQHVLKEYPNTFLKAWRILESDLLNLRSFFRLKVLDYPRLVLEKVMVSGGGLELELFNSLFAEPWDVVLRVLNKTQYGELVAQTIRDIDAGRAFIYWEQRYQEIRLQFIQPIRRHGFGIETLFGYLILKEIEMFAVRRIAVGHANHISKETIKEGLPEYAFV